MANKLFWAFFFSFWLLGGGCMSERTNPAWAGQEEGYSLDNGLKIILAPEPGGPVVSMRLLIKAGSTSENGRAEYGLAHLMEHMAFKGTAKRRNGEISALVESRGGDMNAYTSFDETVYYLTMPAGEEELGLDILADMVFSPAYDPGEYAREKEVVIEEIKRGADSPDRRLSEAFWALAFPDHPYGRPVIGFEETVKGASLADAKGFHRKFYRPDNAILVAAGGFEADKIKPLINRYYGGLKNPQGARPARNLARPAAPEAPRAEGLASGQAELAKVIIGFPGPAYQDPSAPMTDLVSSILSDGRSSRLYERIKRRRDLVVDISSYSFTPRDPGVFLISFETSPEKVLPAAEAVFEELGDFFKNPPSQAELSRARILAEKGFIGSQETASGQAGQIAGFENMAGDWRLKDAYLAIWNRATLADLLKAGHGIINNRGRVVAFMLPLAAAERREEISAGLLKLAREFETPEFSFKAAAKPVFENYPLAGGARLLVMNDPALPLVSVKAGFLGGLLAEPPEQNGLMNFLAADWARSTLKRGPEELAAALDDLGAQIGGFSGRNSFGLSGSFLAATFHHGLELFGEVLTQPAFDPVEAQKVKNDILFQQRAQNEQLAQRTLRLLAKNMYVGHPYSRDALGTSETVSAMTTEDLALAYRRLARPENLVVAVAGDVNPAELQESFNKILAGWDQGEAGPAWPEPAKPRPESGRLIHEDLDRAQTHLAMGFSAAGLGEDDQAALEVLDAYFSGMGGALFSELRDRQSLAYTVTSIYTPGLNGVGGFTFYIACDPRKKERALAGMNAIIAEVRAAPPSVEAADRAKRYVLGLKKIGRQTLGAKANQALFDDLYQLGPDSESRLEAAISRVKPEDLQRAALKYLSPERAVTVEIGPAQAEK